MCFNWKLTGNKINYKDSYFFKDYIMVVSVYVFSIFCFHFFISICRRLIKIVLKLIKINRYRKYCSYAVWNYIEFSNMLSWNYTWIKFFQDFILILEMYNKSILWTALRTTFFRLAPGNQGFLALVQLLAMFRAHLSAVITRLMSKCARSGWKR